jgi:phage shock protein A
MGFFERLSRLFRANANAVISSMEDPGKILDQSVEDMQRDLVKLRQAVATAIASQKRIQNQAEQAESQSKTWYERAELALKKGEEDLAREALSRRKTYQDTATALNTQLQTQSAQVEQLKKSLLQLESKISEAKTKKDMLKARAQAAQAQEQLQSAVTGLAGRCRPGEPVCGSAEQRCGRGTGRPAQQAGEQPAGAQPGADRPAGRERAGPPAGTGEGG